MSNAIFCFLFVIYGFKPKFCLGTLGLTPVQGKTTEKKNWQQKSELDWQERL